jgi:hypothetical protein
MDEYVYLDPQNWYILPCELAPLCADTFFVLPTCNNGTMGVRLY